MALTDEGNGFYMPVAPTGGNNGAFGGDWAWIILLLLLGWGNGGFNGGGNNNLYPWMNQADMTASGFQNAQLNTTLAGIQAGVNAIPLQMSNNTIADLERSFANQTAATSAIYGVQSSLQNCCCENRAAAADLKYTIATENCADRVAIANGLRDVLTAQNANTQRILDQMCADKIEAKNDTIAQLRQELLYARGQASQVAQTAALVADNTAQTQYIVNRVAPYPIPAYTVANPVTPATT